MNSKKYFGLVGIIFGIVLLFVEVIYQDIFSVWLFTPLIILTLYLGICSWQYALCGDWKNSIKSALKITSIIVIISVMIGFLKRILN